MKMNWLIQSSLSVPLLMIAWLSIRFFQKNLGVPAPVFLFWYLVGGAIIVGLYVRWVGESLAPSWGMVAALLVIGLTLCGVINLLTFTAAANAPNPGLPVAIQNTTSICTFLMAILLAWLVPAYFTATPFGWKDFAGIVFVVIGASLIAVR